MKDNIYPIYVTIQHLFISYKNRKMTNTKYHDFKKFKKFGYLTNNARRRRGRYGAEKKKYSKFESNNKNYYNSNRRGTRRYVSSNNRKGYGRYKKRNNHYNNSKYNLNYNSYNKNSQRKHPNWENIMKRQLAQLDKDQARRVEQEFFKDRDQNNLEWFDYRECVLFLNRIIAINKKNKEGTKKTNTKIDINKVEKQERDEAKKKVYDGMNIINGISEAIQNDIREAENEIREKKNNEDKIKEKEMLKKEKEKLDEIDRNQQELIRKIEELRNRLSEEPEQRKKELEAIMNIITTQSKYWVYQQDKPKYDQDYILTGVYSDNDIYMEGEEERDNHDPANNINENLSDRIERERWANSQAQLPYESYNTSENDGDGMNNNQNEDTYTQASYQSTTIEEIDEDDQNGNGYANNMNYNFNDNNNNNINNTCSANGYDSCSNNANANYTESIIIDEKVTNKNGEKEINSKIKSPIEKKEVKKRIDKNKEEDKDDDSKYEGRKSHFLEKNQPKSN